MRGSYRLTSTTTGTQDIAGDVNHYRLESRELITRRRINKHTYRELYRMTINIGINDHLVLHYYVIFETDEKLPTYGNTRSIPSQHSESRKRKFTFRLWHELEQTEALTVFLLYVQDYTTLLLSDVELKGKFKNSETKSTPNHVSHLLSLMYFLEESTHFTDVAKRLFQTVTPYLPRERNYVVHRGEMLFLLNEVKPKSERFNWSRTPEHLYQTYASSDHNYIGYSLYLYETPTYPFRIKGSEALDILRINNEIKETHIDFALPLNQYIHTIPIECQSFRIEKKTLRKHNSKRLLKYFTRRYKYILDIHLEANADDFVDVYVYYLPKLFHEYYESLIEHDRENVGTGDVPRMTPYIPAKFMPINTEVYETHAPYIQALTHLEPRELQFLSQTSITNQYVKLLELGHVSSLIPFEPHAPIELLEDILESNIHRILNGREKQPFSIATHPLYALTDLSHIARLHDVDPLYAILPTIKTTLKMSHEVRRGYTR